MKKADTRKTTSIIKAEIKKRFPSVQKLSVKTDSFANGSIMYVRYHAPEAIEELEIFVKSFQYGHFNGMEDIYEYSNKEDIILQGYILKTYKYCLTKWYECEAKPEPKPATETESDGISLVDYSDKAIAITGDTKPLKDTLKALGGRFNFRLKCGAGWIFPKTKEDEVRQALSL